MRKGRAYVRLGLNFGRRITFVFWRFRETHEIRAVVIAFQEIQVRDHLLAVTQKGLKTATHGDGEGQRPRQPARW